MQSHTNCRQTKQWFPTICKKISFELLRKGRKEFSKAVQLITGHNFLQGHKVIDQDNVDPLCRSCGEDDDTSHHVVAEGPAFAAIRLRVLGTPVLQGTLHWSTQIAEFLPTTYCAPVLHRFWRRRKSGANHIPCAERAPVLRFLVFKKNDWRKSHAAAPRTTVPQGCDAPSSLSRSSLLKDFFIFIFLVQHFQSKYYNNDDGLAAHPAEAAQHGVVPAAPHSANDGPVVHALCCIL